MSTTPTPKSIIGHDHGPVPCHCHIPLKPTIITNFTAGRIPVVAKFSVLVRTDVKGRPSLLYNGYLGLLLPPTPLECRRCEWVRAISLPLLCTCTGMLWGDHIFLHTNLWYSTKSYSFKAANNKAPFLSRTPVSFRKTEGSAFVKHHAPPLDIAQSRVNPRNTFPQNSFKNYPPVSSSVFTYLIKMCKIHA